MNRPKRVSSLLSPYTAFSRLTKLWEMGIGLRGGSPSQSRVFTRPQLEMMEDRTVPSFLTTTTLSSSDNPEIYGQGSTITATVTSTGGTPTGTVTFYEDAGNWINVGTETLMNGQASIGFAGVPEAPTSFMATYNGDSNFDTSSSATFTEYTNFDPTTTSLTSSVNPSAVGQSVTFTATVTGSPLSIATPMGTVAFMDGSTVLGTATLDSTGTATFTTSSLTAGSHSITADYIGDQFFSPSASSTLTQMVGALAPTSTILSSSDDPGVYGENVTITATVSSASGTPTGTVTFYELDGSTWVNIGTETLANGQASFQFAGAPGSPLSYMATYNGDNNFSTSSSNTLTQSTNPDPTTTSLTSSVNPSAVGQAVTFTATVTGNAPSIDTPVGTVTFMDGSTVLGNATLNSTGTATFTTSSLAAGSHSITADYNGNVDFVSSSSSLTQMVGSSLASTTTTLGSSDNPEIYGEGSTITATVTSASGTPTGTITFYQLDGSIWINVGTETLVNGQASIGFAGVPEAPTSFMATYNGNGSFATSSSAIFTEYTIPDPTTTALTSSVNPSAVGQAVTFTATVTGSPLSIATPNGPVTFMDGSTVLGTATLDSTGIATFTTSSLTAGSHSITAVYTGNIVFGSSTSSPLTQVVNSAQAPTTTTLSSSVNPEIYGQGATITATVTSTGGTPTGTVTFYELDGSIWVNIGTETLVNGQASIGFAGVPNDPFSFMATYNGNSTFATSSSATFTEYTNFDPTTTSLTSSVNPSAVGQAVTFTATVTGSPLSIATPMGTVAFMDGSTVLGTATLDSTGTATFTTSTLSAGTHSITADYNGDQFFSPSASSSLTQIVNSAQAPTTTTLRSSVNPEIYGQGATITATVTSASGTPTGTITFYQLDGSIWINVGTETLVNGQASIGFAGVPEAPTSFMATYNGNSTFATSSSATFTEYTNPDPTTIQLAASANPSPVGQPVTFTATVTGSPLSIATPNGTVTFMDGSTVLGTATLNSSGTATFTTSTLSAGTHSITAVYNGNVLFVGSTSSTLDLTIG